jgi:hypothetical protein
LQSSNSNPSKNPYFITLWQPRRTARQLTTGRQIAGAAIAAGNKSDYRTLSGECQMLWTITIILFILWIVGLVSSYTLGGWIHILLVLAVIVLIFNLLSGRRAL